MSARNDIRARALLEGPAAWLDRVGDIWLIRSGRDRRRRPLMRLETSQVQTLKREPGLSPRTQGGWVLSTSVAANPPGSLIAGRSDARLRRNRGESPTAWLAWRKGPDGAPWLSPAQVAAAERLREDFERAGTLGRLTMDWRAGPRGAGARGPGPTPAGGAARRRVEAALAAAGPGLREVLEQVLLASSPLQAAERTLGLPARSGKTLLGLALDRLARHYRLA